MTGMKVDKALNYYAVGVFVYNMVAKVWLKRKQKNPYQGVLANKWYIYENVPRNY